MNKQGNQPGQTRTPVRGTILHLLVATIIVTALSMIAASAAADWPMPRNNQHRTAVASGTSNLKQPIPFWREFLGGAIRARGALALDLDGDSSSEVVLVAGGKATAYAPLLGDIVWERRGLNLLEAVGASDLDGDGTAEVVVRSTNQVHVLRANDGEVLWSEPAGEMGVIGGVRLVDLNDDGLDDLLIQECICCSVQSGEKGFVYSFANSISAPTLLWKLPVAACGGIAATTIAKMVPGGKTQVVLGTSTELALVDGSTGNIIGNTGPIGEALQAAWCRAIDAQGSSDDELLCVMKAPLGPPNNGRRLILLRYNPNATPKLEIAWQTLVGQVDGGVSVPANLIGDLDNDGSLEIVVNGQALDGSWNSFIYDISNGALLGQISGEQAKGTAPILPDGSMGIITKIDKQEDLHVWTFSRSASDILSKASTLPSRDAIAIIDDGLDRRGTLNQVLLTTDINDDGVNDLITSDAITGDVLRAYDFVNGGAELASFPLKGGTSVQATWRLANINGAAEHIGLAQSNGELFLLDKALQSVTDRGLRFGGYYSSGTFRFLQNEPVIGTIDENEKAQSILVPDSRGALLRLNAENATLVAGAERVWERADTRNPILVAQPDGGSAKRSIVAIDTQNEVAHAVVRLSNEATVDWVASLPGVTLTDLIAGNRGSDGTTVFVEWGMPNDLLHQVRAINMNDGKTFWDATPYGPYNRQPAGAAVADWDEDGIDDFVFQSLATRVIDGSDGVEVSTSAEGYTYYMPHLKDVDGDDKLDVTLHASYAPAKTLTHDLATVIWEGSEDDRPLTYASLVSCPDNIPRMLGGSWLFPSRMKITEIGGANAGQFQTRWLAGGEIFDDEQAAFDSGKQGGQLGSPSVHENLAGDNVAIAVVGSSDGFLYAFEACSGAFRFSVDMGAPVGTVIFGDSDGNGLDELIVSVADGFLYGLKEASVSSPDFVWDVDPPQGISDEDVDTIATTDTLYGKWTAVTAADSYEVAILDRDQQFVYDWSNVGMVTETSISGLPLVVGEKYYFAVRAYKGSEASPDGSSDGVRVQAPNPVQEPAPAKPRVLLTGRSCVCALDEGPHSGETGAWYGLLLAGALTWRRRRSPYRLAPPHN